ncbi:MAG: DUF5694 domain-containing protein [Croceivirga sp.]
MKRIVNHFSVLFLLIGIPHCVAQQEILIVGDMHQVPGIAKRAYRPMLRKILDYAPELIMAEYSKTGDTAAMGEWNSKFKEDHLAKKQVYVLNQKEIKRLEELPSTQLNMEHFKKLQEYYLSIGDQANHRMYGYFVRHGATEKFKPYGNQNPDLTFQLMRQLGLKKVYGVDSHEGYKGYWPAWQSAQKAGSKEAKKSYKRATRRITWNNAFAILTKSLGRYVNKPKTLEAFYRLNSLRYKGFKGIDHQTQQQKWDRRNSNMAKTISSIVKEQKIQRAVLIVGAGHAKAVHDELQEHAGNLKIIMYNDLKDHLKRPE